MSLIRTDGRSKEELRPLIITPGFLKFPEGSALIELGDTKIICTATVEEKVPPFLKGLGQGWVTAEYAMLPRSTEQRSLRERGRANPRSLEIQRLIGRSLRAVTDLALLGERTIWLDCDVIQADGGTRTASISGAFVALALALNKIRQDLPTGDFPLKDYLAAVSVGLFNLEAVLDLSYEEDSAAEVDMNVVMTASGMLVEVQGAAEKALFDRAQLDQFLDLARAGAGQITAKQKQALGAEIGSLIEKDQ